jgi:GDPmannose 4,6-dehydratase
VTPARSALITGITGQDGSYLAELLLEKGYDVFGLVRETADDRLGCTKHLRDRAELVYGDLLKPDTLTAAVVDHRPDELYHLAAPSFLPASWQSPAHTLQAISTATATLLEAVRDQTPHARVFIASSAAMFGAAEESPQREDTSFRPQSPYAIAKLAAHRLAELMRSNDGLFVCAGLLYNHESERRPESFVSRRITSAAAEIKLGHATHVTLGNLDAVRDWSYAADIMRGAWLTLQQDEPDDYILASGQPHTVAQLAQIAFAHVGLDARDHIQVDPTLKRPAETIPLVGDPTRARERLGWRPTLSFEQLVHRMVDADLQELMATPRSR